MKNKIISVLLICFSIFIYPQGDVKFEQLSLQDGVAHNLTNCMLKDKKGYLWFGTMYGLARYEGKNYTIFKHDPEDPESVSFDDIISLYEDSKGNIWVGTRGGGLNVYNPAEGKFTRFMYEYKNPYRLNDNIVRAVCEDKSGAIWIGTQSGGLNRYNPGSDKFTHYISDDSVSGSITGNTILSLLCDSEGNLWAGSNAGLSKYDYKKDIFQNFTISYGDENNDSIKDIRVIFEDSGNNLLIGTSSGIYRFDKTGNFKIYISDSVLISSTINSIAEDDKNNLWIGTSHGLYYFNKKGNNVITYLHNPYDPFTVSGNSIQDIVTDNSGILWVNAYGSGINKSVKERQTNFYNIGSNDDYNSLSHGNVLSLTEGKDGMLWAGTSDGLNRINPSDRNVTRIYKSEDKRNNSITALTTDTDGNLWVGSLNGLRIYDVYYGYFYEPLYKGLSETGLFSSHITALLADSSTVWIGTDAKGLFRLDRKNDSLYRIGSDIKNSENYRIDHISTICKDKKGRIWAGTYGGLLLYEEDKNSFRIFKNNPDNAVSLSNNYVFSIFEDSKGRIWVGTSNGLNRLDEINLTFEHFFEKDDLPNSVICAVTEDISGNLWISTNKGICRFNPGEKTFTGYDISDGLGENLFTPSAGITGKNNKIVFGGNRGIVFFYPGQMKFSRYDPPVYISSVKKIAENGDVSLITSLKNRIEISPSEKTIIISFASLDFSDPGKNKFAYMIEGLHKNWIDSGIHNSISFTNPDAGEYVLKVRGTNSEGVFSSSVAELKIIVNPPFWQTLWFQLAAGILVLIMLLLIIRSKKGGKVRREMRMQKIKEEENTRIRKQTAIDFQNEINRRLTKISFLTNEIRKKLPDTFGEIDPMLHSISENSHILLENAGDFIWLIDPGEDNLFDLSNRLKDFGDELFRGTGIRFYVKGLSEELRKFALNPEWNRQITMIFKEAMNNTLKYSECSNAALEILAKDSGHLEIFLFDDGKGFDTEADFEGSGLKNMRYRAEKINGTLIIDSRPIVGTKILFKGVIPSDSTHYNRKVA